MSISISLRSTPFLRFTHTHTYSLPPFSYHLSLFAFVGNMSSSMVEISGAGPENWVLLASFLRNQYAAAAASAAGSQKIKSLREIVTVNRSQPDSRSWRGDMNCCVVDDLEQFDPEKYHIHEATAVFDRAAFDEGKLSVPYVVPNIYLLDMVEKQNSKEILFLLSDIDSPYDLNMKDGSNFGYNRDTRAAPTVRIVADRNGGGKASLIHERCLHRSRFLLPCPNGSAPVRVFLVSSLESCEQRLKSKQFLNQPALEIYVHVKEEFLQQQQDGETSWEYSPVLDVYRNCYKVNDDWSYQLPKDKKKGLKLYKCNYQVYNLVSSVAHTVDTKEVENHVAYEEVGLALQAPEKDDYKYPVLKKRCASTREDTEQQQQNTSSSTSLKRKNAFDQELWEQQLLGGLYKNFASKKQKTTTTSSSSTTSEDNNKQESEDSSVIVRVPSVGKITMVLDQDEKDAS